MGFTGYLLLGMLGLLLGCVLLSLRFARERQWGRLALLWAGFLLIVGAGYFALLDFITRM